MRAAVFDLDGVLVDSVSLFEKTVAAVLNRAGYGLTRDQVVRARIANVEKWVDALLPEGVPARSDAVRELSARVRHEVAESCGEVEIAAGIPAVLSRIGATHRLFLLTNSSRAYTHAILSRGRLDVLFTRVVTSDDPYRSKEEAIAFIAEACTASLRDVVYIGDTVRDVRCAKNAGCRSVVVYTPWSWDYGRLNEIEAAGPDAVVKSLDATGDVLEKWRR